MGRHVGSLERVFCGWCQGPIVACEGYHGDWMHEASRRERCAGDSTTAVPETPAQCTARLHHKAAEASRRRRAAMA